MDKEPVVLYIVHIITLKMFTDTENELSFSVITNWNKCLMQFLEKFFEHRKLYRINSQGHFNPINISKHISM